jgi:tetratricopeptide (TPR) repeat protein
MLEAAAVVGIGAKITGPLLVWGVKHLFRGRQSFNSEHNAYRLSIPWNLHATIDETFDLLDWRACLSTFVGRDEIMDDLREWIDEPMEVAFRFVHGEGGSGKSRLGAEIADEIRKRKDWEAGIAQLSPAQSYGAGKRGSLIIVDYPEEHPKRAAEIIQFLASIPHTGEKKAQKTRVLFLTRKEPVFWYPVVEEVHARALIGRSIFLQGLESDEAGDAYQSGFMSASKKTDKTVVGSPKEAITAWIEEEGGRSLPLFVVAAALRDVVDPEHREMGYDHREIVEALAKRELIRLRDASRDAGFDQNALPRLWAMAAIAGVVTLDQAEVWGVREDLQLGLGKPERVRKRMKKLPLFDGQELRSKGPDPVAAVLVSNVIAACETPRELLWTALENALENGIQRLIRLDYDAVRLLGAQGTPLREALETAVRGNPDRCKMIEESIIHPPLPPLLLAIAVSVGETLIGQDPELSERSRLLTNLSHALSAVGHSDEALQAIEEAVKIHRGLAKKHTLKYRAGFGRILNNYSVYLSNAGHHEEALNAIEEAVEIYRELAKEQPENFSPSLAMLLHTYSIRLAGVGRTNDALKAIQEAVKIIRIVAKEKPNIYRRDLALRLVVLTSLLQVLNRKAEALTAVMEAVSLNRELSAEQPEIYIPYYANSLGVRGSAYYDLKHSKKALADFKNAIKLLKPFAENYPGSEPDKWYREIQYRLESLEAEMVGVGKSDQNAEE